MGVVAVANVDHSDLGDVAFAGGGGALNDLGGNLDVDPELVGVALNAGSPMIDAGSCTGAPGIDFEGDPRPSGGGCDIGAVEFLP